MTQTTKTPPELRAMFGRNLRELSQRYPSVSEVARQLGINRTQLNRYLSGESFPRPDVLDRICTFFGVDARILLEPIEDLPSAHSGLATPQLQDFLGPDAAAMRPDDLPSGFYRFSRRSFMDQENFVMGLVRIWRDAGGDCLVRGFEPREALRRQGLPLVRDLREFRGLVLAVEGGIALLIARRRAMTCSFNFITRVPSYENNYWAGYVTRTVTENATGPRATRLVYEYLGPDLPPALAAARGSGIVPRTDLPAFHDQLLKPDIAFQ